MKRRFTLIIYLLIIACSSLQANQSHDTSDIDSLKQRSLVESDYIELADIHYQIADYYYPISFDSSLKYAKKYLEASENIPDSTWIADAYNFIAYIYDQHGDINLATKYFKNALEYYLVLNDLLEIAYCYINLGYVISYGFDQPEGLRYFIKSLDIAESISDSSLISDNCCNVAYFYERLKDIETAYDYYRTALDIDLAIGDSLRLIYSYANIANINILKGNFSEAEVQLSSSKEHITSQLTPYDLSYLYTTYIDTYLEWSIADSARYYIDLVDLILVKNEFKLIEAYLSHQKGVLNFIEKDYKNCLLHLDQSIAQFIEIGGAESLSELYFKKAEAYSHLNLFKKAYDSQVKALEYKEALRYGEVAAILSKSEQEHINKIELLNNQLEFDLKKQLIENSNIKVKTTLKFAWIILILMIILLGIIVFLLLKMRKKNAVLNIKNDQIEEHQLLLERNLEKIRKSEEELKKLNATKDRFFSIIAHDLKSPLSSIMGLSGLYMDENRPFKTDQLPYIMESFNATANYGINLLENLFEWALSNTGELQTRPEKIEMGKLLNEQLIGLRAIADRKNISIELQGDSLCNVYADRNMVKTIVRNLVHNAIKFSFEKSVVRLSSYEEKSFLVICVEDEGIGIPSDKIDKLFTPYSLHNTFGTGNEKGSGLGLILCQEFISKNEGKIWVENNANKGCTFSFSLPLYVDVNSDIQLNSTKI